MFNVLSKVTLILVGLVLCNVAGAQCFQSLWGLVEVFSNSDGSVQFVILQSAKGDGVTGSLAGQTLVASDGSTQHSYTFGSDLPDVFANPVLVATQGFADLNLVKPDFILPNGFVFLRDGTLRLASGEWCGGPVHYDPLPTDGVKAYFPDAWGDGSAYVGDAGAANNARESFLFTPNFGGLWWNAPAGSEPGSGIAIDHQRDIVFAAWATHDPDGSPAWYVIPRAERVPVERIPANQGVTAYYGTIYRASGPAFGATPFDSSIVQLTKVGTGRFEFGDANDGTFEATIIRASAQPIVNRRNIVREAFADSVPVCNEVGPAGPAPNFQGMWWKPTEAGWGLYIAHQGDTLFAVWFAYDAAGKPAWLTFAANRTDASSYAGAVYRTTGTSFDAAYDPAAVSDLQVGSATLMFSDRNNGTFSSMVNGIAQSETIARQIFADPPTVCN